MNYTTTENGALSLNTPDSTRVNDGRVSIFFRAVRGLNNEKLIEYLNKASVEDIVDTFVLVFNLRDCRGNLGKGEREMARIGFAWLLLNHPRKFLRVFDLIEGYGRWDDLLYLFPNTLKINTSLMEYDTRVGDEELVKTIQGDIVKYVCSKLVEDKILMTEGKPVSLLAKWLTTERTGFDKKYRIVRTICEEMGITEKQYRQDYISPLRAYCNVVERYMCDGKWDEIEYSKVPSCAMNKLKGVFERHSPDRFAEYKNMLSKGETKVNAKQLMPHELVKDMREKGEADEICIAQWKVLQEELEKLGVFHNVLVVVDVSSSMHTPGYLPIDVAIGLGMMISPNIGGYYKDTMITFQDNPSFVRFSKDLDLYEKYRAVEDMGWGGSTNLQRVFDKILDDYKADRFMKAEQPKKIFIISDMQFNQIEAGASCSNSWSDRWGSNITTNFEEIDKKYNKVGLERPDIIFWNVAGSYEDFPVSVHDSGTVMISGFSPGIMSAVMKGKEISTESIMKEVLNDDRYKKIRDRLDFIG